MEPSLASGLISHAGKSKRARKENSRDLPVFRLPRAVLHERVALAWMGIPVLEVPQSPCSSPSTSVLVHFHPSTASLLPRKPKQTLHTLFPHLHPNLGPCLPTLFLFSPRPLHNALHPVHRHYCFVTSSSFVFPVRSESLPNTQHTIINQRSAQLSSHRFIYCPLLAHYGELQQSQPLREAGIA